MTRKDFIDNEYFKLQIDDYNSITLIDWLSSINLTSYCSQFYRNNIFTIQQAKKLNENELMTVSYCEKSRLNLSYFKSSSLDIELIDT